MTQVIKRSPPERLIRAGNPFVKAILRSPLHPMLSRGMLLLTVTGRRSGRDYTFPIAYSRMDGVLTLVTDHAWKPNLRGGADVGVRLAGREQVARAELIEDPVEVFRITREQIAGVGGWAKASRLGFRWDGEGEPSDEEFAPALATRAIVRLHDLRDRPDGS